MDVPIIRAELGSRFILRNAAGEVVVDTLQGIGVPPSWDEIEALLPASLVQQLSGEFVPLDKEQILADMRTLLSRCVADEDA